LAEELSGLQTSAGRLARSITVVSDGVSGATGYPAGSLVHLFETFYAVSGGAADMRHSGITPGINKMLWQGLTASECALIEAAEVTASGRS
jgi:hypothetical protein